MAIVVDASGDADVGLQGRSSFWQADLTKITPPKLPDV